MTVTEAELNFHNNFMCLHVTPDFKQNEVTKACEL